MAAWEEDFLDALRTGIAAVCPEVVDNGIWEGEHAADIPWADLEPPYMALAFRPESDPDHAGLDGLAYRFPLSMFYLAEVPGPRAALRAKLEALRDYFWANDIGPGQVTDVLAVRHDRGVEGNEQMMEKNQTFRVGLVALEVLVML